MYFNETNSDKNHTHITTISAISAFGENSVTMSYCVSQWRCIRRNVSPQYGAASRVEFEERCMQWIVVLQIEEK